jgi:hypothetical protein
MVNFKMLFPWVGAVREVSRKVADFPAVLAEVLTCSKQAGQVGPVRLELLTKVLTAGGYKEMSSILVGQKRPHL